MSTVALKMEPGKSHHGFVRLCVNDAISDIKTFFVK